MAIQIPIWALGLGRSAGRALAATVTLPIWLCVVLLVGILTLSGLNGESLYQRGLARGAERERTAQTKIADNQVKRQDRITTKVEHRAERAQTKIEYRYRTLRQKVSVYVPLHTGPGVIRAGDRVPASTVLLLDAAVRGDEPEPISVAAGETYELGSPVRFDQLVDGYIVNLGVGHQNARQLTDLQDWVSQQKALDAD